MLSPWCFAVAHARIAGAPLLLTAEAASGVPSEGSAEAASGVPSEGSLPSQSSDEDAVLMAIALIDFLDFPTFMAFMAGAFMVFMTFMAATSIANLDLIAAEAVITGFVFIAFVAFGAMIIDDARRPQTVWSLTSDAQT